MSHIPSFSYDQQSVPSSPATGQTWRERDSNKSVVQEWFWNGSLWLSINTTFRDVMLITGQSITLTNIIVGLVTANTDNVPFSINSAHGMYLVNMYAAFRINTGNLSSTNYWSLNLYNGATKLQTLNVQSGDDGSTTGDIRKSVAGINTSYPSNGKYSFSLTTAGVPPSLNSPNALIEYNLVR